MTKIPFVEKKEGRHHRCEHLLERLDMKKSARRNVANHLAATTSRCSRNKNFALARR